MHAKLITRMRSLRRLLTDVRNEDDFQTLLPLIRGTIDDAIAALSIVTLQQTDSAATEAAALLLLSTARTIGPAAAMQRWWITEYEGFDRAIDLFTQLYGDVTTQELKS